MYLTVIANFLKSIVLIIFPYGGAGSVSNGRGGEMALVVVVVTLAAVAGAGVRRMDEGLKVELVAAVYLVVAVLEVLVKAVNVLAGIMHFAVTASTKTAGGDR